MSPIIIIAVCLTFVNHGKALPCKFVWKEIAHGDPLPPDYVQYSNKKLVARGQTEIGFALTDAAWEVIDSQKLLNSKDTNFPWVDVLTNPYNCNIIWSSNPSSIEEQKWHFTPVNSKPNQAKEQVLRYLVVSRVLLDGRWNLQAINEGFFPPLKNTQFLLTSDVRLNVKMTDYVYNKTTIPRIDKNSLSFDYVGEDEFQNLTPVEFIEKMVHTTQVTETIKEEFEESIIKGDFHSTAEDNYPIITTDGSFNLNADVNRTSNEQSVTNLVAIDRTFNIPGYSQVHVCSVVVMREVVMSFTVTANFYLEGYSGTEIKEMLNNEDIKCEGLMSVKAHKALCVMKGSQRSNQKLSTKVFVHGDAGDACTTLRETLTNWNNERVHAKYDNGTLKLMAKYFPAYFM